MHPLYIVKFKLNDFRVFFAYEKSLSDTYINTLIRQGYIVLIMSRKSSKLVVVSYSPSTGKLLKVYKSARQASLSRHNGSRAIEKAIRGERDTAFGYIWKRVCSDDIPECIEPLQKKRISRKPVPIAEIDICGNVITTYSSIRSASKALNIDPHSIRDNLSHKFKTANGHMFRCQKL